MTQPEAAPSPVLQTLIWGPFSEERAAPADTMFAVTGRRIYAIGDIDGRFRPRSNPYDLHTYGHAHPDDPLAEKLQGVWAQPVKGFDRYGFTIEVDGTVWRLENARQFTQHFASVRFDFQRGSLAAERRDFAALDLPVLFSELTLRNEGTQPLSLRLSFNVTFDLQDAWFTSLTDQRNQGQSLSVEHGCLLARAASAPEQWAAATAGLHPPDEILLTGDNGGTLVYQARLAPGAAQSWVFAMTVQAEDGAAAALDCLSVALPRHANFHAEQQARWDALAASGPRLVSPDPALNAAFALARANLQMLEAEQPPLGRYFYAGLEMFPFWFSCDGAYSLPGLLASGLREPALNHLRIGLEHLDSGRVPHQISPSGRVAFAGNAQETPLWVMGIWDAFRWTGDRDFLAALYPGARQGMFEYVLGSIDPDGDGYPSGPGMVEVEGMGAEKLDSAAYTWAALRALAQMADVLGKDEDAQRAAARAEQIAARFDTDWWDADGGTYAMSLQDPGNARFPVAHWAVIVPLEVGLASAQHAAETFATLRAAYLNRWGLKHTVGDDERVWTLPTAALSRAAYRYQAPELGFRMLRHIAETLEAGSIGVFHELIPEGACFIQLWSAAVFLRGMIEDLLGIEVDAPQHRLRIFPQIPNTWQSVALEDLVFGAHRVSLRIDSQSVTVQHHSGPAPLVIQCGAQAAPLPAGASADFLLR